MPLISVLLSVEIPVTFNWPLVIIPVNVALPSVVTVATPALIGPTWIPDRAVTIPSESTLVTSSYVRVPPTEHYPEQLMK